VMGDGCRVTHYLLPITYDLAQAPYP